MNFRDLFFSVHNCAPDRDPGFQNDRNFIELVRTKSNLRAV